MSAQPYQVYPQTFQKGVNDNEPQPEKQTFGYIVSIVIIIYCILTIVDDISSIIDTGRICFFTNILSAIFLLSFQALAVFKPDYLKGKPSTLKLIPLFASLAVDVLTTFLSLSDPMIATDGNSPQETLILEIAASILIAVCFYFMYGLDDESDSCCLCFKPWIHKRQMAYPIYGQYPPQPPQFYSPQFYPPQPQQAYYAPQGYPPQGYPQQGNPAYPPQQAQAPTSYAPQQSTFTPQPAVYPSQQPQQAAYPSQQVQPIPFQPQKL